MALNLYQPLPEQVPPDNATGWVADLLRARQQGWAIHSIRDMQGLLDFARAFARLHYAPVSSRRVRQ